MEVQGTVMVVGSTMQVSDKFKKRELVVQTEGQYPQDIIIEFHQDKVDLLNGITEGEEVKVGINLRGRKWINPEGVDKYFNTLAGWRVEATEAVAAPTIPTPHEAANAAASDDLPF